MHARYYDPATGQFISPDTLVPNAADVLSYNRYMYARGNPLKFTDPSGHYCIPAINLGTTCASGGGTWDKIQLSLDAAGLIEPTPISDGANALISAARGEGSEAGLSALGMIPYLGDLAKGAKYGDEVWAGLKLVERNILEWGASLGSATHKHHWSPQALHNDIRNKWGSQVTEEILQQTDPLIANFHRVVHGKGGTLAEPSPAEVRSLVNQDGLTWDEFLVEIDKVRTDYLRQYQDYLNGLDLTLGQ